MSTTQTLPARTETIEQKKLPTIDEIRKAVPKECFEKHAGKSLAYLAFDLLVAAALYKAQPFFETYGGWPGLIFWYFIIGMIGASIFCVGHDCGHGTFSNYTWLNDLVGHFAHGMLFAPYWPWQHSHRQHHMYTGHLTKDKGVPWVTEKAFKESPTYEKVYSLTPVTALVKWHIYTIFGAPDGSHFWPGSELFHNNIERIKCVVSAAVCVAWATAAFYFFGATWNAWFKFYMLPCLCQGLWLIIITFLQHQSEDIQVYEDGTWNFMKGQLQTIDRPYGLGIDYILHHITDGHVAHHFFFTSVPHYNLMKATKAIEGVLRPYGLYKKKKSYDFLWQYATLCNKLRYLLGEGTGLLKYAPADHQY